MERVLSKPGLQNNLNKNIENAYSIITKSYISKLDKFELSIPNTEINSIDIKKCAKFFKINKLVLNKEENLLNKMITVVNVASVIGASIATIIKSDGKNIDFLFGIVSKKAKSENVFNKAQRSANSDAFRGAIEGNFIGSDIVEVTEAEMSNIEEKILGNKENYFSSISGIVSKRELNGENLSDYTQGIENLVDSLNGKKYTIVMIADPINSSEILNIKNGYELIYSGLSHMSQIDITMSESETKSMSQSTSETISKSISDGISMTQGNSLSSSFSYSQNKNLGIGFILNGSLGESRGVNTGRTFSDSKTQNKSFSSQNSNSTSKTFLDGHSNGKSIQVTYEDRRIRSLLDKIDKNILRLEECDNYGAFKSATYVISEDLNTNIAVASNYSALMRGENTGAQSYEINTWRDKDDRKKLTNFIKRLSHPVFKNNDYKSVSSSNFASSLNVTPASILSGNEVAVQIGLPKKSISGLTVISMSPFGRNIKSKNGSSINLGKLYHMGKNDGFGNKEVNLDIESLAMHTFITGSTGSGKSTIIYSLLDRIMNTSIRGNDKEKIKFMVIEPAKGEYKDRFSNYENVEVYGTNFAKTPLLRINPFSFPDDIHVLEHIDRLVEIFNVCWPMYAAMPAVLKDSIERAYLICGWNLTKSTCLYKNSKGGKIFPTFSDVLNQIIKVINDSYYSDDSKGNYQGALCTRLKSLTNGIFGQIFTSNELSYEELFDRNVIVDLSRVSSVETKSLLMGILVMKLQEYRMSDSVGNNEPLKHITVLEEAHNILKKTSSEQTMDGSNLVGKSVEMLSNSIAEMRTYGEGFFIVDQAPGLMDMSVIRNTNTKIILRLPDLKDRELVGKAASLNKEQIDEISRFNTFIAAVYQNNWIEPVLCNVNHEFKETSKYKNKSLKNNDDSDNKIKIVKLLFESINVMDKISDETIDDLKDNLFKMDISSESKILFLKYFKTRKKDEIQEIRQKIVYDLFNVEEIFRINENLENNIDRWIMGVNDSIEPALNNFEESIQNKIIATILKEKVERITSENNIELFNKFMDRF